MTIAITKGSKGTGAWCDRRSPLGNPFNIASESQRGLVCTLYQQYFDRVVAGEEPLAVARSLARPTITITSAWCKPTRAEFVAALDRLSSIYQKEGAIALKCWCINVEIKTRSDLVQKKRCHCLSIAGHLLPSVGGFSEQLT